MNFGSNALFYALFLQKCDCRFAAFYALRWWLLYSSYLFSRRCFYVICSSRDNIDNNNIRHNIKHNQIKNNNASFLFFAIHIEFVVVLY